MTNFTFYIQTFGCQMNEHDSEKMAGLMEAMGAAACGEEDKNEADVRIINTCSVRENADQRFFGVLGQLKKIKQERPEVITAVCGCMMQQPHIVDEIKQRYAWVDLIFGTHNIHKLPRMLEEIHEKREKAGQDQATGEKAGQNKITGEKAKLVSVWDDIPEITEGVPVKRMYDFKAFVSIMQGCNNFCTYCIVPYTRGREKSRHPEAIIDEITALCAAGTKEVILLGQNVNSYGKNCDFDMDFTDLAYRLDAVPGLSRLRFMTSHPKDIPDKLIEAFRKCGSLYNCIHLPVQSGSNAVLRRMNRGYTREDYLSIIDKLKAASPGIAISTDIIVGFPGETEKDFADTLALVKDAAFDSAFTFIYSKREGTPAAGFQDQVPEAVKHERFNRLIEITHGITAAKNKKCEGKIFPVLVEGKSKTNDKMLTGRTPENRVVNFPPGASAESKEAFAKSGSGKNIDFTGKIIDVRITEAKAFSLMGEIYE